MFYLMKAGKIFSKNTFRDPAVLFGLLLIIFPACALSKDDIRCASRNVGGETVVCVCNSTYCDNLVREVTSGQSTIYHTSKEGFRFHKNYSSIVVYDESIDDYDVKIEVDLATTFQSITGFGGAVTDAAALNWKNLSSAVQDLLIESYYGTEGIGYNMIRVPIGGTDFSTRAYAYNEYPEDDGQLTNFTLTVEDTDYKIPMINACISASNTPLYLIGTTWSPPPWMKTNNDWSGISRLKSEYYQTYADYHIKFLEKYKEHDIDFWALTTTNEPINGVLPFFVRFNSLGWSVKKIGKYITENLGPTLRNSSFSSVKILVGDDQQYTLPFWIGSMIEKYPEALNYIDGVAVHWYGDSFTTIAIVDVVAEDYPKLFILGSEACQGSFPWQLTKVKLGSWERGVAYAKDIIKDLTHSFVGWMEWNLCLNPEGGPTWASNNVDSPIIVYSEADEFIKQPMFYVLGHFTKFIRRGSVRVEVTVDGDDVSGVAFVTPEDTLVLVLLNTKDEAQSVRVKISSKQVVVNVPADSVTTLELKKTDLV